MAEATQHGLGNGTYSNVGSVQSPVQEIGNQAKDVALNVASQAKDVASNVVHQASDMVASQLSQRQEKSAGDLKSGAEALREAGKQLEGNMISPYVEKVADQMDKVSQFVRTTNVDEVKTNVESFARREPLLFLGGAFALGILGARFLKSASPPSTTTPASTPKRPMGSTPPKGSTLESRIGSFGEPRGMGRP